MDGLDDERDNTPTFVCPECSAETPTDDEGFADSTTFRDGTFWECRDCRSEYILRHVHIASSLDFDAVEAYRLHAEEAMEPAEVAAEMDVSLSTVHALLSYYYNHVGELRDKY